MPVVRSVSRSARVTAATLSLRRHAHITSAPTPPIEAASVGENQPSEEPKLIQIRLKHEAPDDLVEECGHPNNKPIHLMVTPISGCAGFEAVPQA